MERKLVNNVAMAMATVLVFTATMQFMWLQVTADGQGMCNMTQQGFDACKPFIRTDKPTDTPAEPCCTALKAANLTCLCSYKGSSYSNFLRQLYGIDLNRAYLLPDKCGVAAPQGCSMN